MFCYGHLCNCYLILAVDVWLLVVITVIAKNALDLFVFHFLLTFDQMSAYVLLAYSLYQAPYSCGINELALLAARGTNDILSEEVVLSLDYALRLSKVENLLWKMFPFAVKIEY